MPRAIRAPRLDGGTQPKTLGYERGSARKPYLDGGTQPKTLGHERGSARKPYLAALVLSLVLIFSAAGEALASPVYFGSNMTDANYCTISSIETAYNNMPGEKIDPASIIAGKLYVPERKELAYVRFKVNAFGTYKNKKLSYRTTTGQNGVLSWDSGSDWTAYIPADSTISFIDPTTRETLLTIKITTYGGETQGWYWEEANEPVG